MNDKRSYTEYTVTTATTDFVIGFDDYDESTKDSIVVTVDGVLAESQGFAVMRKNSQVVTITPAVQNATVRLERVTDIDKSFHQFTAGALFSAKSVDQNFEQIRHSQQEVRDGFTFLEFNTNGIVQASKEATLEAKAATATATASAVRAESAAVTAVQAVGAVQGVVNAATTATASANTASTQAAQAASTAVTATTAAQSATQAATAAQGAANTAANAANAATTNSNAATGRANAAADVVDDLVLGKVRAQDVSTADGSTQEAKNTEYRSALNALPFVDGVLADTFVTMTKNAVGSVARNLRDVKANSLTPYDFGVKGDFNEEKLSARFTTLALAKAQYPNAIALTEIADRVAFDAFLKYIIANSVSDVNWACKICLDKPLVSLVNCKTGYVSGDLHLLGVVKRVTHALHIATVGFEYSGTIYVESKTTTDIRERELIHGVIMGSVVNDLGLSGLTGSADNCNLGNVIGGNLLGFAFVGGQNAHFSKMGNIRGAICGSALKHPTSPFLQGMWDDFTSNVKSGGDLNQRSTLTISTGNLTQELLNAVGGTTYMTATVDGEPYDVISINLTTKKVVLYPALPTSSTGTGNIIYHFGGAVHMGTDGGNNTSATGFATVQAILCGVGLDMRTLYGANIDTFTSEFCGVGTIVGNRQTAHIGTVIGLGYFEGNKSDILFMWTSSTGFKLVKDIALDINKVWQMFSYSLGTYRRTDWFTLQSAVLGSFAERGDSYELSSNTINNSLVVGGAGQETVQLTMNHRLANLQNLITKKLVFIRTDGAPTIKLLPPTGWTLNGQSEIIVDTAPYEAVVSINLCWAHNAPQLNIAVYVDGVKKSTTAKLVGGTTAERPTDVPIGYQYFDTTINKAVYYKTTGWVNATGVAA